MNMCEFRRDPVLQIISFSSGLLTNPLTTPLLNVALLLTLSTYLITARHALKLGCFNTACFFLILSIIFGLFFIHFQLHEFFHCGLSINDGIYGSLFFMLVGFHGAHVVFGVLFLIVCYLRFCYSHFTPGNHFALEAAI
jgi:cytochrome c oxidase subunit 3